MYSRAASSIFLESLYFLIASDAEYVTEMERYFI